MSPDFHRVYQDWALEGTYLIRDQNLPARSHGVCLGDQDTWLAMMVMNTDKDLPECTFQLVNVDEVQHQPFWTKEQLEKIQHCACPGAFLDPLGFIIAQTQYRWVQDD
jgi:hypothetical protein